ncbi:unnamed protein product [Cylicostephanus goldi]|uniref:Uncharacterized protein n=1 Tax=Cylicostephanus goldi TaxID=71465 RepID=A0A3P6RAN2_CYLGO|nr:unnamed protein product [Cylicostephanus goldi]
MKAMMPNSEIKKRKCCPTEFEFSKVRSPYLTKHDFLRIIPNKWAFAYVSLGPAAYFGSEVSYIAYCVQLHALFYTFLSFPLSFGFRYHVLIRPMPKVKRCILICFGLWLVAFAQHVSPYYY